MTPSAVVMPQLGTQQLTVVVFDQDGEVIPAATPTFTSGSPAVVSVSSSGLVSSLGPSGTGTVVVTVGTVEVQVPMTVRAVPTTIDRLPAAIRLGQGGFIPLRARVLDRIGNPMAGAAISYHANSPSVVELLPGNFTHAIGPIGSAEVVATYTDDLGQASATASVTVEQFAAPTGSVIDTIPTGATAYGVSVSDVAAYVALPAENGTLHRLDLPARSLGPSASGVVSGLSVAVDPSGGSAYAANRDASGAVAVVNVATNAAEAYIKDHIVGDPLDVTVSPDGQRLYVATPHVRIYVVNTLTREVVDSILVPGLPNHFSWHPGGSLLYVSLDNAQVAEIDVSARQVSRLFPTASLSQGTAVALDGTELYTVTENNELVVTDLATGTQAAKIPGLGGFGLVASPDGSRLYVAGGVNVKIVDRASRTLIDSIVVGGGARRIALSRDGGAAFVANEAGWINVIY
ncbi:MAG TPA: hypothetical protein VFY42_01925 [Gemmatimonadales bacterium]|nr:hypothetical protein [Gemmatimonadales bacterium]